MLMIGLAKMSHFGLWDIIPPPPPESQLSFHIYYIKYENTLTCKKGLIGTRGNDVLKIFMDNTKSDHFSAKIKPYIYGNRKSNAKS